MAPIDSNTQNGDERDLIQRPGRARGSPGSVNPRACLAASCVAVRTTSPTWIAFCGTCAVTVVFCCCQFLRRKSQGEQGSLSFRKRFDDLGFRWATNPYHAGLFTGHDPARGSDQEVLKTSRVESGRVRGCLGTSWVGSGEIRRFSNLKGRGRVTLTRADPREVV